MNNAVRIVNADSGRGLKYHKLEEGPLKLKAIKLADEASCQCLRYDDATSQLGYILLLCDAKDNCHVLQYKSYKSRRVTRSVLSAEVAAFADAFDCAFVMKYDLERMLKQRVRLSMLTDSKSLFDVLVKNSYPTEKRLLLDLAAVRESYQANKIDDLGLIRSADNPAVAFTKVRYCPALEKIFTEGVCNFPTAQWIVRGVAEKDNM